MKEILARLQNRIGLFQKRPDNTAAAGSRGVDRYDELPNLVRLLVFQRLDQRQVAVMLQSIGIVNIVKFLVVDRNVLPHDREAPENLAVIVAVPCALLEVALQRLRTRSRLGKGFQIRLHSLADLLPLLLRHLKLLRRLPQVMAIPVKKPPQFFPFAACQRLVPKMAVQPLRGQSARILLQHLQLSLRVRILLQRHPCELHIDDRALDGNVRRQIPFFPVQLIVTEAVEKDAVKQRMKVAPRNQRRFPLIALQHIHRIIKQCLPVRGKAPAPALLPPRQLRQRQVKKAQVHQKFIMRQRHDSVCQG